MDILMMVYLEIIYWIALFILKDFYGNKIKWKWNWLSTGIIIRIIFGYVDFLLIVVLIIICRLKRRNNEKGGEMKETEKIPEKKEGEIIQQNIKDDQENNIKVIEFNKNNEIIDTNCKIMNFNNTYIFNLIFTDIIIFLYKIKFNNF